ncbi:MAG: hypothetical protein RLZZ136_1478 [Pseudomonadota bacterium]
MAMVMNGLSAINGQLCKYPFVVDFDRGHMRDLQLV